MAFNSQPGSSSQAGPSRQQYGQQYASYAAYDTSAGFGLPQPQHNQLPRGRPPIDPLEWYPYFVKCQRYFLDHSQYSEPVQAVAAFINIQLPYQKKPHPILSSAAFSPQPAGPVDMHPRPSPSYSNMSNGGGHPQAVSLTPYIRRLVATGQDSQGMLHGWFGEDFLKGIGDIHECERRNFMFTAKSAPWNMTKQAYDISPEETCPFLRPLNNATEEELQAADSEWSEWIAMGDWMLGPRRPETLRRSPRIKGEPQD